MNRFLSLTLACALVFVVLAALVAPPQRTTVVGQLVDSKCYGMDTINKENTHMVPGDNNEMVEIPGCASACAKMGIPAALLQGGEVNGDVFILLTPAGALAEHMAKDARVTGQLAFDGGLIPEKVEVKNNDGTWEEVNIVTMM